MIPKQIGVAHIGMHYVHTLVPLWYREDPLSGVILKSVRCLGTAAGYKRPICRCCLASTLTLDRLARTCSELFALVSVRNHLESCESFVIQEW
jgi:hypothetical protein